MSARLLVVEDNEAFVENLTEILSDLGHEVRTAGTVKDALVRAKDWVQVALVDVGLPDGDGTRLAERLKSDNPDCEVILLTGHASVESAASAVRAGVWDYLVKPTATPDLLTAVNKALRHVLSQVERRELTRRAQRAERLAAVGTLTAGLSHEIRNPLNAAGLQLSVLERRITKLDPAQRPPLLEPLTLARDEIRRLEHILRDFLQFARPAPVTVRPVQLEEVMGGVVSLMRVEAERRGLTLRSTVTAVPAIMGDHDQLKQVLMNLALNALDAAKPGGTVEVSTATTSEYVHLRVDDDGPGVPEELRARLFEPFFTTKAQGSGLGLSICHGIVAQHGGRMEVGTAPLGGARFEVLLPR